MKGSNQSGLQAKAAEAPQLECQRHGIAYIGSELHVLECRVQTHHPRCGIRAEPQPCLIAAQDHRLNPETRSQ